MKTIEIVTTYKTVIQLNEDQSDAALASARSEIMESGSHYQGMQGLLAAHAKAEALVLGRILSNESDTVITYDQDGVGAQ